jgi:hypothetical protein
MRTRRWLAGTLVAAFALTGCSASGEALGEASNAAATLHKVDGSDFDQVTLSSTAYQRLGVRTTAVRPARAATAGKATLVVPSAALLFDAEGKTWVYVQTEPRSFLRTSVTLDRVAGNTAYLTDGPKVGTIVATVGVPELFGAEEGVEGE